MRAGARNRIFGTVTEIKKGKLMWLVKVEIPSRSRMASVTTWLTASLFSIFCLHQEGSAGRFGPAGSVWPGNPPRYGAEVLRPGSGLSA